MKELLRLQHVWKSIYNFFIIYTLPSYQFPRFFFYITKKYIIYIALLVESGYTNSQNRFLFPKQIPFPKTFTPHLYQRRLLSACTWKNRPVCACDEKRCKPGNQSPTVRACIAITWWYHQW